jgi:hypothetical protein
MLIGDDQGVKPDRMVLRWLAAHDVAVDASDARAFLQQVAAELTIRSGVNVTPWMVDHAIWKAERGRPVVGRF